MGTQEVVIECKEEDCTKKVHSKELCQMHYRRFRNHGSTEMPVPTQKPGPKPDPSKPYSKHKPPKPRVYAEITECPQNHPYDEENTYFDGRGYKHCRTCQRDRMQERRSLEPRPGQGSNNRNKTHCPQGHEYNEENTIYNKDKTGRSCRLCYIAGYPRRSASKYGLTPEIVEAMKASQDNCCAICKREFIDTPHIDHDHACCPGWRSCGKCVRGLLCMQCNHMLGRANDSIEVLKNAIVYLETTAVIDEEN